MVEIHEMRRLLDRRVVVPILIGLALIVGYQVYAYRQSRKVNQAIAARTASTCPQVDFLYASLVQLMASDSAFTPAQVARMRVQGASRVAACRAAP
jgi:hypothetical protein